jgi:hypothetical protein
MVVEFETPIRRLRGEMTTTIALAGAGSGTEITVVHDGFAACRDLGRKAYAKAGRANATTELRLTLCRTTIQS